ncbi:hypothetical protein NUSPORA_00698 [Nucleospora cyclopteri]
MRYTAFLKIAITSIFIMKRIFTNPIYLTKPSSLVSMAIFERKYENKLIEGYNIFLKNKGYKKLENIEFIEESKTLIIHTELFNISTYLPNYDDVACYIYYKNHAYKHTLYVKMKNKPQVPAPVIAFHENIQLYKYMVSVHKFIGPDKIQLIYKHLKEDSINTLKMEDNNLDKSTVLSELIIEGVCRYRDIPSFIKNESKKLV